MSKTQYAEPTVSTIHRETFSQPDNGAPVYFVNSIPNWIGEMTVGNFTHLVKCMSAGVIDGEESLRALAV